MRHTPPLEVLHAAPSNDSKPPTGGFINAKKYSACALKTHAECIYIHL